MNSYVMYHCHTDDSLLDSATNFQDYIDLAVRDGSRALSISEHGKPMNWTEKWNACKEAGIKYIHSVEIYLTENLEPKVKDNYHTVLIAKNYEGLLELNELVSRSCNEDHFYFKNRISFDEFLSVSDNIISTSACIQSPLAILPETHPRYMELANKYTYLEVQYHNFDKQKEFNKKLVLLAKRLRKPLIAGTDTHSSTSYKAECREILMKAKNMWYYDEEPFDLSYKTYDELVDAFKMQGVMSDEDIYNAIENTNRMADTTEEIDLDLSIKYPILYGTRENDERIFIETTEEKFKSKVDAGIIPKYQVQSFRNAIDEEMEVFKKLEMTGFMLSMSELISWCKETGKAIGVARGSVGGSRIAYVTDITDLNPETWHTVFSRFCNEHRKEIGDIDIDCVDSDRPAIFKHIEERFGSDKVARVASFGTIKDKGVVDEVVRGLSNQWKHEHGKDAENPWTVKLATQIKELFQKDPERARKRYKDVFYYYDGLLGVKISQSVHPAGMVISPITLPDHFGVFKKDGDVCMFLDMDNVHDFTGLAKYDFLVLKTVTVIRDTCNYIGTSYPKAHEVNWEDENVWDSMIQDPTAIFQFEELNSFKSLQKFKPKNIFDMSIVTACIRPSGASYRDKLLDRIPHKNPSEIIDNMLKDNLGYLIYQEDTIKFLQDVCGLSGGDADNIRRAIGRKQKDRLDKALPDILNGYCSKSDKIREVAEEEAKEFLRVIEDSASYQFGYNHSIAYCLLGYLCAYYRYYHPVEFISAFLNNAANDDDVINGTAYAQKAGIRITSPKWGVSRGDYSYDADKKIIAKGMSSIKYIGAGLSEELYQLSKANKYTRFIELLQDIDKNTSCDTRQLDILIKIDFFDEFGNNRELFRIKDMYYDVFKRGTASKISRSVVDNTPLEPIVKKYSVGTTKAGKEAKSYTVIDIDSIMSDAEDAIKDVGMEDLDIVTKIMNFKDCMGYIGYVSNRSEDRSKLYILRIRELCRKSDGKQFGYSFITKSIGSGKESMFTVVNSVYNSCPVKEGDLIVCTSYSMSNGYFRMNSYSLL